jgi:F-type H+/Na+-transporting ATPase subunit alpha
VRPAMNAGVSVSRVGGAAQRPAMKKVSGTVRLELAQFRELEAFAQFGSDLDKASQQQIARGQRVVEILKQAQYQPLPVELQVASVVAVTSGVLDELPVVDVSRFESELHTFLQDRHSGMLRQLATEKLSDDLGAQLRSAIDDFAAGFTASEVAEVEEEDEGWDAMAASSERVE